MDRFSKLESRSSRSIAEILALRLGPMVYSVKARKIATTEFVVKNHLRIIYDKVGLWNRVEIALWDEARKQREEMN